MYSPSTKYVKTISSILCIIYSVDAHVYVYHKYIYTLVYTFFVKFLILILFFFLFQCPNTVGYSLVITHTQITSKLCSGMAIIF